MMEYEIRTLKDIFELPTSEMMERCLSELATVLVSARSMMNAQAEILKTLAENEGVDIPAGTKLFEFPEVMKWRDDEPGESEVTFNYPGGQEVTMKMTHAKPEVMRSE